MVHSKRGFVFSKTKKVASIIVKKEDATVKMKMSCPETVWALTADKPIISVNEFTFEFILNSFFGHFYIFGHF